MSVNSSIVDSERHKLREILTQYCPNNVYNVDESGLYWRQIPKKTYLPIGVSSHGIKQNKQRITIAFTVSLSGENLILSL